MCLRLDLARDGHAVDAERERLTHELEPQRRVAARAYPKREVLHHRRGPGDDAPPRKLPGFAGNLRAQGATAQSQSYVELVPFHRREWVAWVLRCETGDEAVEVRGVRPPVPRVPDEREPLSSLPALDEERAAADPTAGLRVVDPVAPDLRDVESRERVARQHHVVQLASPVRIRLSKRDLERLRVEHADRLHLVVIPSGSSSSEENFSWVNWKSEALTGTPSLQRASGRMWYVSLNGFVAMSTAETRFGRTTRSGPGSNAPSRT